MPEPSDNAVDSRRSRSPLVLSDDRELLFHFLEGVPEYCIFLTDTNGRIVVWNAGARRAFEYCEDEIIGEPISRLFTPEDSKQGVPENELRIAVSVGRTEDERWHQRKNNSRFWASGSMMAVRDATGELRGFCKILRDLTEQHKLEEARSAAHLRDQRIADALQRAMIVPVPENAFPGVSIATIHEAAWDEAMVGGDFFDAFLLGNDLVAFAVGDASGKGLAAAVRTTQVKDVLRALLRSFTEADASRTLSQLNDYMCESKRLDEGVKSAKGDIDEGFVVLSLMILHIHTGVLTLATAGGEPPVVLRADGDVEFAQVMGLPLGIEPKQEYPSQTVQIDPGDVVLMMTDGITEARRGRQFLSPDGAMSLVSDALTCQNTAPISLVPVARHVLDGAKAFAGGKLHDDACVLLMRRH